ncbi:lipopolysaccharide assembly protein LapB [Acidipila sp. EB88]|uniref:tetratricopeptide repeat protein n=1 Tax=Acidipila sp. EB88 TaxID=2305226 RepID=UPI000F601870|nr:tetratricopeptide repeat protein [Acidipila sp. EB88]RRA47469.1 hypothetical protein D1Y84_03315 [Acidipila sp. EB88]
MATAESAQAHGELLLTLPFENVGTVASVDWIGAAFPEILNRRFAAAGFLPISRNDRAYAFDHLGLPPDFQPTHASTLRLAQTLDADSVLLGTYQVDGTRITATVRVLDMADLREGAPLVESADLSRLPDVINALAWRVVRQLDPTYPVAEETFVAADSKLRLDAFEDYVRGLVQGSPEDRLRRLRDAVRLDPTYGPAWLALGDASFAAQDYEGAATAYGHLTRNDPDALQADFHRGLAYFYTGKYLPAEDAFAFVSTRLPLPEVVNNQGVASARRGKDGAPLFQQAIAGDPKDADYHFNLALAYARRSDAANAQKEAQTALQLRPSDSEIQTFNNNLRNPGFLPPATPPGSQPASATPAATNLPLERIKRSYDEAAFRQAAFELEQMETLRAATQPPAKQVTALLAEGNRYLNAGLLVESEREYNRAIAVDPQSADAYCGLARVRERTGDHDAAAQLAKRSLQLHDNAAAHVVLARLALAANQVPVAATELASALRLDANNAEARGLRPAITARGGQVQ